MRDLPVVVIQHICSFHIQFSGDHFDLFPICRNWATAVSPSALEWETKFQSDLEVQAQIESEQVATEQARRDGVQALHVFGSDSESEYSDFNEGLWSRWAADA